MQLDFSRQLSITGMNASKQEKLLNSKLLIFGAGGLGATAIPYLAMAGISNLTIIDFDHIENSNLHRQTLFKYTDLGKNKAEVVAQYLQKRNINAKPNFINCKLTAEEIEQLLPNYDLILDCTDDLNFSYLLNSLAIKAKKTIVFGNAVGMHGQIFVMQPKLENFACFNCVWPRQIESLGKSDIFGILGPVAGNIGSLQAIAAIKHITGIGTTEQNKLIYLDFGNLNLEKIQIKADPACKHN